MTRRGRPSNGLAAPQGFCRRTLWPALARMEKDSAAINMSYDTLNGLREEYEAVLQKGSSLTMLAVKWDGSIQRRNL
jgi:hypothetical protein